MPERGKRSLPTMHLELTPTGLGSKVVINDIDMSTDVRTVKISAQAGEATLIELGLLPTVGTINGWAKVALSESTKALLLEMGWTPPEIPVGEHMGHLSSAQAADSKLRQMIHDEFTVQRMLVEAEAKIDAERTADH